MSWTSPVVGLFRPDRSNCKWPDPTHSVGERICFDALGKKYICWRAVGPARHLFDEELGPAIEEYLKCCGSGDHSIVFITFCMIGKAPETAAPKIIFSCKDKAPRKRLRGLIENSSIMTSDKFIGIGLGDSSVPPEHKSRLLAGEAESYEINSSLSHIEQPISDDIVLHANPSVSFGASLFIPHKSGSFNSMRKATAGPIVCWKGKAYCMTIAHVFDDTSDFTESVSDNSTDEDFDFDGMSDSDSGFGEDVNQGRMSRGSFTSDEGPVQRGNVSSSSSTQEENAIFDQPSINNGKSGFQERNVPPMLLKSQAEPSHRVENIEDHPGGMSLEVVGTLSWRTSNLSLDYALIKTWNEPSPRANTVAISPRSVEHLAVTNIAEIQPKVVDICTVTSSSGILHGKLRPELSYIRLPKGMAFQRVYSVHLDGTLADGDCGSGVIDAQTGDLYGHIIAGTPGGGFAFIVPATDVFKDLRSRLEGEVTLFNASDAVHYREIPHIPPNPTSNHGLQQQGTISRTHDDYTVGWIYASPQELTAAQGMLDEEHPSIHQDAADSNQYTLGRIGTHNVVLVYLSVGTPGVIALTVTVARMRTTFQQLQFVLMVGIGGGIPSEHHDIRLGDVVVSDRGVVQYDMSKIVHGGRLQCTEVLLRPTHLLLLAFAKLQARCRLGTQMMMEFVDQLSNSHVDFAHPGTQFDVLYQPDYDHPDNVETCALCETSRTVDREPRPSVRPVVHYGLIASGNQEMRHGGTRERLRKEHDILCFNMEAAGLIDVFPSLIIRGICDYSDSHKNKRWHAYAAATAAAYAKELLSTIQGPVSIRRPWLRRMETHSATALPKELVGISPRTSKMADPMSIAASVLAAVTVALQSTNSLYETIKRFKDRNKTLRRLQHELEDLANILNSFAQATNTETSMLALLQSPIDRCSQVCHEFEQSMKVFSEKSKMSIRDWTKMEFMRGDINEFIDTIAEYKSTISVGLGTITMYTTKVSQQVLQEYNEMIQDTTYNLEIQLQRIDEKMAQFTVENTDTSDISIDLKDERAVTTQCLRICEDAQSYIESLTNRESSFLQEAHQNAAEEDNIQTLFEAQLLTSKDQAGFAEIISRLRERLESLVLNRDPGNNNKRLQLMEDINISKQYLEMCKVASEVSNQKIHRFGEVIADGESDQVVVTTLADLFDIKKALSKGNSMTRFGFAEASSTSSHSIFGNR